ncbi:MAG: tetratricopeptide repeat protein [Acidobacteriia bacterium]|nr:tetratricopeptide repeat protein [Terriglobia bacterium]
MIQQHDLEGATRSVQQAIEIYPKYFLACQMLGALQLETGHTEDGLNSLKRATEINPNGYYAFHLQGSAQLMLGKLDDSLNSLQKAVALNPKSHPSHLLLGFAFVKKRLFKEAEGPLQKAYSLGGDLAIEAQRYLAVVHDQLGRREDARAALALYLKHAPKEADKEQIKGLILKVSKDPGDGELLRMEDVQ